MSNSSPVAPSNREPTQPALLVLLANPDPRPSASVRRQKKPAILSFLPFVWGKYWVIDLAEDYSYAVVGEPNREYLWILSRSPSMDPGMYARILDRITQQGYDSSKLVRTRH